MKSLGLLVLCLLAASSAVFAQTTVADSTFSLYFNSGLSFSHAGDPHINRWLKTYGYPEQPHVPTDLNFELAAMPAASRMLFSVKISTVNSGGNFSSYNALLGAHVALVKQRSFMFLVGGMAGLHGDIITLDGAIPQEYEQLAASHQEPLALRRRGLVLEPGVRLFWYPVNIHAVQLGFYGGLGYDLDFNSRWKLGYYSNDHGKYSHFRGLGKPDDQKRVSEYGVAYSAGVSFRISLH